MHIHQLLPQLDQIQQPLLRKHEDVARPPGGFEQLTALAVKDRWANDRKQPRGKTPQPAKAPPNSTAAPYAPATQPTDAPGHGGAVDIVV